MGKSKKLDKSYAREKPVNIRDIFTDKAWSVNNVNYNSKSGKYEITANHTDGRNVNIKRNRQYVDKLIKELEDVKKGEQNI